MSSEEPEDDGNVNENNSNENDENSSIQQPENVLQTQTRGQKRPNSGDQGNETPAKNTCTETNGASGSERHDEESSEDEEPVLFSEVTDSDSSVEPIENETEWGILLRVDNRILLEGRASDATPLSPSPFNRDFMMNATSLRVIVQHYTVGEDNRSATPNPILPALPPLIPAIPPTQRSMWMRQQVDAENRRRRATAGVVANTNLPPTNFASTSTTDTEPVTRGAVARSQDWMGTYINVSTFRRMLANVLRNDDGMVTPAHNCLALSLIQRCTVVFPYSLSSGGEQRSCVICISEYLEGQDVRRLPCLHLFHKECVDRWMLDQLRCPICRYDILDRAVELYPIHSENTNEPGTSNDVTNTQNVE